MILCWRLSLQLQLQDLFFHCQKGVLTIDNPSASVGLAGASTQACCQEWDDPIMPTAFQILYKLWHLQIGPRQDISSTAWSFAKQGYAGKPGRC